MSIRDFRLSQATKEDLLGSIRHVDSLLLGKILIAASQVMRSATENSYAYRRFIDFCQPRNPLHSERGSLPFIDVVTVTAPDTYDFAETSITAAIDTSSNPVRSAFAIVPDAFIAKAREKIPSARVIAESEVLPAEIFAALEHFSAVGRKNWVLCQVLGLYFARNSTAAGVLVVDADTYLLEERTWLDSNGHQLLSFSHEYHHPYEDHCSRLYGSRRRHRGLSYISHYMLMQPSIVREIFPDDASVVEWIRKGDASLQSAVADYHTYGRWLVENYPKKARIARWDNNRFVWPFSPEETPADTIEKIRIINEGFLSASSHRYLEK